MMQELKDIYGEPVYQALMVIRQKPGLWLGGKSLRMLDSYIRGFMASKTNMRTPMYCPEWYSEFIEYAIHACGIMNEDGGVVNSILICGYDEESGFDYFYDLLDEFVQQYDLERQMSQAQQEEVLKPMEARVLRMDREASLEVMSHYISDHLCTIFDLPSEECAISKMCCITHLELERDIFTALVCNRSLLKRKVNIWPQVESLPITTRSILQRRPYTLVKFSSTEEGPK